MGSRNIEVLLSLSPGTRFRVIDIRGGHGLRSRLTGMGIVPGTEGVVIHNGGGPMIINIRGVNIAIGRGMASKILVEVL